MFDEMTEKRRGMEGQSLLNFLTFCVCVCVCVCVFFLHKTKSWVLRRVFFHFSRWEFG